MNQNIALSRLGDFCNDKRAIEVIKKALRDRWPNWKDSDGHRIDIYNHGINIELSSRALYAAANCGLLSDIQDFLDKTFSAELIWDAIVLLRNSVDEKNYQDIISYLESLDKRLPDRNDDKRIQNLLKEATDLDKDGLPAWPNGGIDYSENPWVADGENALPNYYSDEDDGGDGDYDE